MRIGVLLSGCGVYDGAEIHEAVLSLLAIDQAGAEAFCFAPNIDQHHVVNHLDGSEMDEKRNVLVEAARIARGEIKDIEKVSSSDFDALMIPGGFGVAKNLSKWAFSGSEGDILSSVKELIQEIFSNKKPIGAICMGPTLVAKALKGMGNDIHLTIGTTEESSPYNIKEIGDEIEKLGAKAINKNVEEILIDEKNKIVSSPCYVMDASISQISKGITKVVNELVKMSK